MAIPIPEDVRALLEAPNYVHLSTLRGDGSPRNWVVWVGLEQEHILVCTSAAIWKGKDMLRDPRVALSVTDGANPYRMAAIQGRVVEVRPDEDCRYMDPISVKYTSAPFPHRGPDRVCFVIAVEKAGQRTLGFVHRPAVAASAAGAQIIDHDHLQAWLAQYERAWRTRGTAALADLFTDDATYRLAPFDAPIVGSDAIAGMWEAERRGADERFTMDSETIAVDDDVAVVRVAVRYEDPMPRDFRDLWIIRFAADGRCQAFEEWPFAPGQSRTEGS
jgi:PPOX class probable F420-dependent enzyme